MTTPAPSLADALQDRYTLERELGRGGMATVYLARDLKHKRYVALKVLRPELAATLGPERFRREIETAARLQHPHILTVHDSGQTADQLWFTMPFVEGESLRDRLRRERQLSVEDAVRITREAAQALQYAHRHGVIHRDIKPENLLLTTDGNTLVADFGISRGLADDEHLTSTGVVLGTPGYMSPEQAGGDSQVDARSDVYSLGCVLYEMLAGERPFTGPNRQALLAKRLSGDVPSVRVLRPTAPEALEATIRCALAPLPADRFATAADLARALERVLALRARGESAPTLVTPGGSSRWGKSLARSGGRRRLPLGIVLLLAVLLGAGTFFAWRRQLSNRAGALEVGRSTPGVTPLAVLPFENLGDSADAYFADGLANDLRTKLAQIAGLAVIARSSSNEYRHTKKPAQQIARELGVDYLLSATVQWEKTGGEVSRVRVTPELVDVRPGHAPQTRWGQQFDAAMTSVFQVQADIAGQVAQALNVALGDSTKRALAAKPTQNLPAYDAYLRGEAVWQARSDPPGLRQALAAYEQAVALDSSFALAWAQLARVQAILYSTRPTPAGAEAARRAAARALALAPTRPEGHRALGSYYSAVLTDNPRAFTADSTALALAPGDADFVRTVASDEFTLGRWQSARGHLEDATRLDPRSVGAAQLLGRVLLYTRQHPAAQQEFDRALRLDPAALDLRQHRAMVALARGNLPAAQAVLQGIPKEVDPTEVVAWVASYNDLYWVLDEAQQQLLLRLTPSAFDDNRAAWGIVLAQTYALQGNGVKARAYADSARLAFTQQLQATPQDAQLHVFLGLALAYLGHKGEAIREGERGVALRPISRDAVDGPYYRHQLARIYLLVGEPEKALDQLEPLLKMPYYLSPGWLRIDPTFDPLRDNPRFERLIAGK